MSKPAKEGGARGSLKRRHLGLAGFATVVIQYLVGAQNENTTQKTLQALMQEQMKTQRATVQAELERNFVRKVDVNHTLKRLDDKLDKVGEKLDHQNSKISKIEGYLKAKHTDFWSQADVSKVGQR